LIILFIVGEEYKLWSSLCSFPHPPITSSPFDPNIHYSTLFSNSLSQCSSLNVRDQVSHPCRTTGKIIVLYILIFMFVDMRLSMLLLSKLYACITSRQGWVEQLLCICYKTAMVHSLPEYVQFPLRSLLDTPFWKYATASVMWATVKVQVTQQRFMRITNRKLNRNLFSCSELKHEDMRTHRHTQISSARITFWGTR
jgi:hypothetical protein